MDTLLRISAAAAPVVRALDAFAANHGKSLAQRQRAAALRARIHHHESQIARNFNATQALDIDATALLADTFREARLLFMQSSPAEDDDSSSDDETMPALVPCPTRIDFNDSSDDDAKDDSPPRHALIGSSDDDDDNDDDVPPPPSLPCDAFDAHLDSLGAQVDALADRSQRMMSRLERLEEVDVTSPLTLARKAAMLRELRTSLTTSSGAPLVVVKQSSLAYTLFEQHNINTRAATYFQTLLSVRTLDARELRNARRSRRQNTQLHLIHAPPSLVRCSAATTRLDATAAATPSLENRERTNLAFAEAVAASRARRSLLAQLESRAPAGFVKRAVEKIEHRNRLPTLIAAPPTEPATSPPPTKLAMYTRALKLRRRARAASRAYALSSVQSMPTDAAPSATAAAIQSGGDGGDENDEWEKL